MQLEEKLELDRITITQDVETHPFYEEISTIEKTNMNTGVYLRSLTYLCHVLSNNNHSVIA